MVYIKHPKKLPFEYNRITECVYLGTNQCCQMHFKRSLLKKGIKADISLEKEMIDSPQGVDYFLWIPVTDKKAPTQKQLLIGARTIKDLVDQKVKIYVHCKRGHGRSSTLVAAYLIIEGATASDALKRIRSKRNIHLTKEQLNALRIFERNNQQ